MRCTIYNTNCYISAACGLEKNVSTRHSRRTGYILVHFLLWPQSVAFGSLTNFEMMSRAFWPRHLTLHFDQIFLISWIRHFACRLSLYDSYWNRAGFWEPLQRRSQVRVNYHTRPHGNTYIYVYILPTYLYLYSAWINCCTILCNSWRLFLTSVFVMQSTAEAFHLNWKIVA